MENLDMMDNFWKNKIVLITGNTGFKGSWLTLWLNSMGSRVIGYSLPPPTTPSLFKTAQVQKHVEMVNGDIRNSSLLVNTFSKYRPDIVFHMAAQSLVRPSYLNPTETYETNIMGTVYVLEAIRKTPGVRVVVMVTSDKCYENKETDHPYQENDPMGGFDPYSSSKGCDELIISAYRRSFFPATDFTRHGLSLASVRAGNVIGGGDWAQDRLVPDTMQAFMENRAVLIRNPLAIRPWQHVLDPLYGYLSLAEQLWKSGPDYAEAWNFGPSEDGACPVGWVVQRLAELWGNEAKWETFKGEIPHEAHFLKLDSSKARNRLKWKSILPIDQALDWTASWYRGYHEGIDPLTLTKEQINKYQGIFVHDLPRIET